MEGAPGVGKTEAAKAVASILGRNLTRLQCYEGIDSAAALYEWNYPRQMLASAVTHATADKVVAAVTKLPITPDKVLRVLRDKGGAKPGPRLGECGKLGWSIPLNVPRPSGVLVWRPRQKVGCFPADHRFDWEGEVGFEREPFISQGAANGAFEIRIVGAVSGG